jgi:hypothetical protein
VACSEKYSSSLIEIQTEWTISDLLDANDFLDLLAIAELEAHEKLNKKTRGKRGGKP